MRQEIWITTNNMLTRKVGSNFTHESANQYKNALAEFKHLTVIIRNKI
jgi:hypothetical protein